MNIDHLPFPLWLRAMQIDRQKPVDKVRTRDLHAIGEKEDPLKLSRSDPAVQIDALPIIDLSAADRQLTVFDGDLEVRAREAGDRERNTQKFWLIVTARHPLDVVGWVSVRRRASDALSGPLDLVEPQQIWGILGRHA